jgi:hypothetical protein
MMIELCDVPRRERHLLFCTSLKEVEPLPVPTLPRRTSAALFMPAINRSLAIHGESVGRTWSTAFRDPAADAPAAA